jgi:E3 ubiquitin-protein ligase HUWE1
MKILHKSKRVAQPHPQVADLITNLLNTPKDDLPDIISQITAWKWPRSDLNAWINVLNKFDAILQEIINEYNIDILQLIPFTSCTKNILSEILRFERLLLENSTNRKMFNSYDRLNSLLFTSDLDVLVLTLHLLLRPSQQYSAQPTVTHTLNISTSRLRSLSKRWPNLREYGVGLVELVSAKGCKDVDALPDEAREIHYSFYRTDSAGKEKEREKKDDAEDVFGASSSSSVFARRSTSAPQLAVAAAPITSTSTGAVTIHIDQQTLSSKPPMSLLADTVEAYTIPEDEKFELLCRIRAASVLAKSSDKDKEKEDKEKLAVREKLVIVRLLAIAIFGHTHSEAQAMGSLFLYEPDLIAHVAELLQIDHTSGARAPGENVSNPGAGSGGRGLWFSVSIV